MCRAPPVFASKRSVTPELAQCLHSLFIRPESVAVLQARLEKRGTEDAEAIAGRMAVAAHEIEQSVHYDHCILTDTPEADFAAICGFYEAIKTAAADINFSASNCTLCNILF